MKFFNVVIAIILVAQVVIASEATVSVVLNPMGSFKGKTSEVKGFAVKKGDEVSAENIVVNLKSLKTGVELRDKHTQKYLETDKFPDAILVSAKGKNNVGSGKIKIKGIEKDIKGTYKIIGNSLLAEFQLKLEDFQIKDINYMGVGVEDDVTLAVNIPIK